MRQQMNLYSLPVFALCMLQLLSSEAQAQRLVPAHPAAPVAFTFPPVRDYTERIRVRHLVARTRVHRRGYRNHHTFGRAAVSRSYSVSRWTYHYLLTGWRPLPYEFGPYSARVVVLR